MSIIKKVAIGLGCAACLCVSLYVAHLRSEIRHRDVSLAEAVKTAALARGAVVAVPVKAIPVQQLSKSNAELVNALKKIDDRVLPVLHASAIASVQDTIVLGPNEHRFVRTLDPNVLKRSQKFSIDLVVVRNVDGVSRLARLSVQELDPQTGQALPDQPELVTETHVEFVDEKLGAPAVFHPRAVAGVSEHGYPLLGVEIVNLERFGGVWRHLNGSVFAGYNTVDKTVFGGVGLNWRLWNSNVSIGPAAYYGGRGSSFGATATIQLTR